MAELSEVPTWILGRANAHAQESLRSAFAEVGLRPLHFRVLLALQQDGPLSQAELGSRVGLDRKDVNLALDFLGDRRLVRRKPDPADGRRNLVALTPAGARRLPRLTRILDDVQRQVFGALSPRELAALRGLLIKITPS